MTGDVRILRRPPHEAFRLREPNGSHIRIIVLRKDPRSRGKEVRRRQGCRSRWGRLFHDPRPEASHRRRNPRCRQPPFPYVWLPVYKGFRYLVSLGDVFEQIPPLPDIRIRVKIEIRPVISEKANQSPIARPYGGREAESMDGMICRVAVVPGSGGCHV